MGSHPLHAVQQELQGHGLCAELPLTFLTEAAVEAYLTIRFPDAQLPPALTHFVHKRTDGNPLFMVNMVDDWLVQGWLTETAGHWTLQVGLDTLSAGVPENLRQLINRQVARLSPQEQRLLEVGSVAGVEFSAAAVAAGLEAEVVQVDEWCGTLVQRRQFLQERSEHVWPDGTVAGGYGFVHALYQEVVYTRLTAGQRVHLHRRIGERQEKGYGPQAGDIAAELAMHFARGRDYWRAIVYLQQAAENALQRYANAEGIEHLTTALQLLKTLPATPERARQELDLLTSLGPALTATRGYGAAEVEQTYRRAHALCQQMGDTRRLFAVLRGLAAFYQQRGELQTANTLAEQLVDLARRAQDPALLLRSYQTHGSTLFYRGELALARRLLEQGMTGYQLQSHRSQAWRSGLNTSVICLGHMAWNLWLLGYPEQALQKSGEALTLAQELAHPHSLAYASHFLCVIHQFHRQVPLTQERAEMVFSLSTEYGLAFWRAYGTVMRGWASALQGQGEAGIPLIHQGLAALRETGGELGRTYFLALLAEAYGKMGRLREGLGALTEALAAVHKATEHFYEAELHRLKGEILLAQIDAEQRAKRVEERFAEVEACFQQARAVARRQQARSLELRAAISLARLWQQQGKHQAAYHLLAEIYAWFEQGFNTADLQEARALLMALT